MNYLAHQFLSFQIPDIQIGNLYGEIVRGKDYLDYPAGLQNGILLHRAIDSFTDSNSIVKESTRKFHENYGKFAPIIVDVAYDYFLIKNWKNYTDTDFEVFVNDCYLLFKTNFDKFPSQLQYIVRHLLQHDWFRNYRTLAGIGQTLKGISQRSKFKNNIHLAVSEIETDEEKLDEEFQLFFPQLISHCQSFLNSAG